MDNYKLTNNDVGFLISGFRLYGVNQSQASVWIKENQQKLTEDFLQKLYSCENSVHAFFGQNSQEILGKESKLEGLSKTG